MHKENPTGALSGRRRRVPDWVRIANQTDVRPVHIDAMSKTNHCLTVGSRTEDVTLSFYVVVSTGVVRVIISAGDRLGTFAHDG